MVTEYGRMVKLLERMVLKLKSEYDFVIGLTEGPFCSKDNRLLNYDSWRSTSDIGDISSRQNR